MLQISASAVLIMMIAIAIQRLETATGFLAVTNIVLAYGKILPLSNQIGAPY